MESNTDGANFFVLFLLMKENELTEINVISYKEKNSVLGA